MGLLAQGSELIYQQPMLLVYRRDILDAQGVSVPETWDQMLQVWTGMWGGGGREAGREDAWRVATCGQTFSLWSLPEARKRKRGAERGVVQAGY